MSLADLEQKGNENLLAILAIRQSFLRRDRLERRFGDDRVFLLLGTTSSNPADHLAGDGDGKPAKHVGEVAIHADLHREDAVFGRIAGGETLRGRSDRLLDRGAAGKEAGAINHQT